jgi:aryl-alcohol dehydrogenase-like predicted oxidoreductase
VSVLALGTWRHFAPDDQRLADSLLEAALAAGINFVDSADSYGDAQVALGRSLRNVASGTDVVVGSKVYYPTRDRPEPGLGQDRVLASVDSTLSELGVERIDVLTAHRFDEDTPLEETLGAIQDCLTAGKIGWYGVSEWTAERIGQVVSLADELHMPRPVANQAQYSPLWREPEQDVLPACAESGVSTVAFWTLAQGVLSGKYRTDIPAGSRADGAHGFTVAPLLQAPLLRQVDEFTREARDLGLTPAQLALAWVLSRPTVAAAVVGAHRPEQLAENAGAVGKRLPDDTVARVDQIFAGGVGPIR